MLIHVGNYVWPLRYVCTVFTLEQSIISGPSLITNDCTIASSLISAALLLGADFLQFRNGQVAGQSFDQIAWQSLEKAADVSPRQTTLRSKSLWVFSDSHQSFRETPAYSDSALACSVAYLSSQVIDVIYLGYSLRPRSRLSRPHLSAQLAARSQIDLPLDSIRASPLETPGPGRHFLCVSWSHERAIVS